MHLPRAQATDEAMNCEIDMSDERTVRRMPTDLLVSERKLTIACACQGQPRKSRPAQSDNASSHLGENCHLHAAEEHAREQHGVRAHALRSGDAGVLAHLAIRSTRSKRRLGSAKTLPRTSLFWRLPPHPRFRSIPRRTCMPKKSTTASIAALSDP